MKPRIGVVGVGAFGSRYLRALAKMPGAEVTWACSLSPEQARGVSVDQRADVYALGLIMYDMLVGRSRLTMADSAIAELRGRMDHAPPTVKSVVSDIPRPLDASAGQNGGGRTRVLQRDGLIAQALHGNCREADQSGSHDSSNGWPDMPVPARPTHSTGRARPSVGTLVPRGVTRMVGLTIPGIVLLGEIAPRFAPGGGVSPATTARPRRRSWSRQGHPDGGDVRT